MLWGQKSKFGGRLEAYQCIVFMILWSGYFGNVHIFQGFHISLNCILYISQLAYIMSMFHVYAVPIERALLWQIEKKKTTKKIEK